MVDFRLNTTTESRQENPTTAALVGGGFVTVWQDGELEGFIDDGIYGYILSENAFRSEFRVTETTEGNVKNPVIEALPNGGFVVGWYSNDEDLLGVDDPYDTPFARFFNAQGNAVTGDIQLVPSQSGDAYLRDIEVLADGSVLFLTEEAQGPASFIWDHTAQLYSQTGTLLSGRTDIATDTWTRAATAFGSYSPRIQAEALEDGGYLTTYWAQLRNQPGPILLGESFARAYDADGTARSAAINISAQTATDFSEFDYPLMANLDNGTLLVAWDAELDEYFDNDDYVAIQYRYVTKDGLPVSQIFSLDPPAEYEYQENDTLEDVVALGGGYAGIVFTEYSDAASDFYQDFYDIKLQVLDPTGQKFGSEISLITSLKEDPLAVELTVLEDGSIMTTYEAEANNKDVYASFLDDAVSDLIPAFAASGVEADGIFFFNAATRSVGQFEMPFATWSSLGTAGSGWQARGVGLFDSDDTSADILWFNVNTRAVGRFDIEGGSVAGWSGIGRAGVGWEVMGAGDFNGDGTDDVLWFNDTTNTAGQFRMNEGSASWASIGKTGAAWELAGIGDLNGDGVDDILWYNSNTGALGQFEMSASGKSWAAISTLGAGFRVADTGDFDGDGKVDVLLFKASSGQTGMFDMGSGSAEWVSLGQAGGGWSVSGTGDFDNSGTDDILWRHSDGRIGQYQMDGAAYTWDAIGVAGEAWDVLL